MVCDKTEMEEVQGYHRLCAEEKQAQNLPPALEQKALRGPRITGRELFLSTSEREGTMSRAEHFLLISSL